MGKVVFNPLHTDSATCLVISPLHPRFADIKMNSRSHRQGKCNYIASIETVLTCIAPANNGQILVRDI